MVGIVLHDSNYRLLARDGSGKTLGAPFQVPCSRGNNVDRCCQAVLRPLPTPGFKSSDAAVLAYASTATRDTFLPPGAGRTPAGTAPKREDEIARVWVPCGLN